MKLWLKFDKGAAKFATKTSTTQRITVKEIRVLLAALIYILVATFTITTFPPSRCEALLERHHSTGLAKMHEKIFCFLHINGVFLFFMSSRIDCKLEPSERKANTTGRAVAKEEITRCSYFYTFTLCFKIDHRIKEG